MLKGEAFRKYYYTDEIEKETIERITGLIEKEGRIGAVNGINKNVKDDLNNANKYFTNEKQGEDKIR